MAVQAPPNQVSSGHTEHWIVLVAASAGGIDALSRLLSRLPAHIPAAVLVVQHLRSDRETQLPEILALHCRLPVVLVEDGAPVKSGVVDFVLSVEEIANSEFLDVLVRN